MQQPAESVPVPTFAGLLASLTTPPPKPAWDDDLADDVATLSYESALRTHARYRPVDDAPLPLRASIHSPIADSDEDSAPQPRLACPAGPEPAGKTGSRTVQPTSTPSEQKTKTASITIRMSQAERDQLLRRAAEADMSVSAYLRSCTFEAESLRALVKDTLARLKQTNAQQQNLPAQSHRSPFERVKRLFAARRGCLQIPA